MGFLDDYEAHYYSEFYYDDEEEEKETPNAVWDECNDEYGRYFVCTNCDYDFDEEYDYCPNCGAYMKEGKE